MPRDPAVAVVLIIIAGVLLRVLIGGVLLPLSGFRIDVNDFSVWAQRLASGGPGAFYETGYFSDYPPGYLYVLWLLGSIGRALQPLTLGVDITPGLVKLPAVLADAGVAWMLFQYSRSFLGGRFRGWSGERVGMVAAAVYMLNPGTIFNSAVWGQVDAAGALVVLLSLYWLARGWTEAASLAAVVALLVKFQYAFVIPIVAIVGVKRHLFGRSADPLHDGRQDPLRVLTSLAAGLGSLVLLIWPFGMAVWSPSQPSHSLFDKFLDAAGTYPGLAINGFTMWRNGWSGLGDTITWGCDAPSDACSGGAGVAFAIGSAVVSWQLVATILFLLAALAAFWLVARRDEPVGILGSALVLATAFFALPTRVHERYLFPALALAAPLIGAGWRSFRGMPALWAAVAAAGYVLVADVLPGLNGTLDTAMVLGILAVTVTAMAVPLVLALGGGVALYGLLSLSFFANVYWVYTADWSFAGDPPMNPGMNGLPMARDPFLGATLLSDWGIYALSAMIVVVLGVLVYRALHLAARPVPVTEPLAGGAALATAEDDGSISDLEPRFGDEWGPGEGWLSGLRRWMRPDPDDPYLREAPGRRIDRLDLLLLAVLMVLALGFRLWRLDTPRGMHFDEVYHARSATEWLADWEHGWTRDTYEWTHPMLAKYLIAAGIVVADPNKVIDTEQTDAPIVAMAVAPQRTAYSRPISIVFSTTGGAEITARNVVSGEQLATWQAPHAVASLAFDEDNERLLAGSADGGAVTVYDISALLFTAGERSPPDVVQTIDTQLGAVLQIDVPSGEAIALFRGPDGIVETERATGLELGRSDLHAGGVAYVNGTTDEAGHPYVVATDPARGVLAVLEGDSLAPVPAGSGERVEELPAPPVGPVIVHGHGSDTEIWVPVGALPANEEHGPVDGGVTVFNDMVTEINTAPLPGRPELIGWQAAADASICGSSTGGCGWLVYITGQDSALGQPAVWAVQPIGSGGSQSAGYAAFDTTPLDGRATAIAFDVNNHSQGDDHARMLVSVDGGGSGGSGGELVQVDVGSNAFAWRLAGVIFGTLLVGIIYLLAASMFRRRRIAVLAAAFIAFDAMNYVMSRISMNDIFVAVFIAAAYLVFWQVWSGRWARSAWWALPLAGILIGLAASTKWVGIYALLGLWILVLGRSRLGRFLLVGVIGFLAMAAGIGAPWPFLVLCLAALALALIIVWDRPIRLDMGDLAGLAATGVVMGAIGLAFASVFNQVEGAGTADNSVELVFAILARGAQVGWPAFLMLGVAALLLVARAGWSLWRPESDRRWWQPGEMAGFAWPWIGACLVVIPLLVYFLAYVPYLQLGHNIAGPDAGPGYGWSLEELQAQMFGYHFGLQAGHASASPWWSWPLDLKPVWFYGHDFDDRLYGAIYNGGNPILFWAGVPAMVFCGIQAWRRRSMALVLLVVAFAFQWLPWTRIERATFHYHYLTAVMFAMVAVAYVTDEMLRSWSWRPFAIAGLVVAAVVGVALFPLASGLAMPDWYINQARTLPPWNYAFKFPDPPQGTREQLFDANTVRLALGVLVGVSAAAFALFGRWVAGEGRPAFASAGGAAHGDAEQDQAQQDEADRPEELGVDARDVGVDQEPDA